MKLKALLTLSILASCLQVAYTQEQFGEESQSANVPTEVRERLSRLVPDPPPARATLEGQPAFYDSPTLYQYMDGAADVFQIYDVQALFHQDFKAGPVDLTVDIFDMGSLENAFGMYAAERSPKYDFVGLGAEGYRNEGLLNFFQDRYYVKLAAFEEGGNAALQEFGVAISKRIGDNTRFPVQLSKLPKTQRIPRTEKYLPKDPLGHPFLGPAYQATYRMESGERILMISVAADPADAGSRMKALEDHFRRTGEWKAAPQFGTGSARGSNSFEGSLVATASGHYVVLLLNPPGNSEPFFQDAAAGLR